MHLRDFRFVRLTLIVFFLLILLYALYEGRGIFLGPRIEVPATATVVHDPYITIQGRAERITELRLNGKTISVTEQGNFSEPFVVARGSNRIVLEARDARGRTTTQNLDIIYSPSKETGGVTPQPAEDTPQGP